MDTVLSINSNKYPNKALHFKFYIPFLHLIVGSLSSFTKFFDKLIFETIHQL